MKLLRYTDGWTRRHFLEQSAKGICAAGVLSPLWTAIAETGTCEAAYPPELLSIEAYTKGRLKPGDRLDASNVDIVKDLLEPIAYWEIKQDGRVAELAPTETRIDRLMSKPFLEATIRNKGKHKIAPDGNVYTLDGKPWIGGNPFPDPKTPLEVMASNTLTWSWYDSKSNPIIEWNTDPAGDAQYVYEFLYVMWSTVGRVVLDPKPYMPGHEKDLRITAVPVTSPEDMRGSAFLQIWAYDQKVFPEFYGYLPLLKRTRTFPTDQRFEPGLPGETWFVSEGWCLGDPLLTWGNFKLVGKGPLLHPASHNAPVDQPNWLHKTCGGRSGNKYFLLRMELVPECYIVELSPTHYPRSPYSKKRVWYDARTLLPLTMETFDRQGKLWQQFEIGFGYYEKSKARQWHKDIPNDFWDWSSIHALDYQSGRLSRLQEVAEVTGGFGISINQAEIFGEYCSMDSLRRLGR
jgi:hypothetical protein